MIICTQKQNSLLGSYPRFWWYLKSSAGQICVNAMRLLKISRKALASDAGLDESYDVGTYPPGPETVSINKGMSPVAAMVLSTAMLATGGGGALGAAKMLGLFDNKTQVQQVEQVLQEQEFDITIEEPGHGRPLKLETRPVP